jgi:hypothetical protein
MADKLKKLLRDSPISSSRKEDADAVSESFKNEKNDFDEKSTVSAMSKDGAEDVHDNEIAAGAAPGKGTAQDGDRPPTPPPLSQLKDGLKPSKVVRDVSRVHSKDIHEDELKRKMIAQFDILRDSYKNADIPSFTIHADYSVMKQTYDDIVKRLHVNANVENYKKYFIFLVWIVEKLVSRFLKFDMSGFMEHHVSCLDSYEVILRKIGEQHYVPEEEQWSPIAQLAFLVSLNTVIFVISKTAGENILDVISSMVKMNSSGSQKSRDHVSRTRMKEPEPIF